MATYPTLSATLSALQATMADPSPTEDAAMLDDALRQTRRWIYDFLSQSYDTGTNKLKLSAFDTSSLVGSIRGSDANQGVQREVAQGTISDIDLRDGAAITTKIADGAISTAKIATKAVTTAALGDGAVTSIKLASAAVAEANLADGSVTANKLGPLSIPAGKFASKAVVGNDIGDHTIQPRSLPTCKAGQIFVGGNTDNNLADSAVAKTLTGVIGVDQNGNTFFNLAGVSGLASTAILAETLVPASSVARPAENTRGINGAWQFVGSASGSTFLRTPGTDGVIQITQAGIYRIQVRVPATGSNRHRAYMEAKLDPTGTKSNITMGTSSFSYTTGGGQYATTLSLIEDILSFVNVTVANPGTIYIRHIIEAAITGGLGLTSNYGPLGQVFTDYFTLFTIQQLISTVSVANTTV